MKTLSSFAVICALALAGCSGAMTFDQHLRQLEGKPLNDADLMLGHHADGSYRDASGAPVYVWQDHKVESIFGPRVTQGGYQIGSRSSVQGGDALIWSGIQLDSCVIRATTTDNIIRHVTFEGNPGGCEAIYKYRKEPLGRNVSSDQLD